MNKCKMLRICIIILNYFIVHFPIFEGIFSLTLHLFSIDLYIQKSDFCQILVVSENTLKIFCICMCVGRYFE